MNQTNILLEILSYLTAECNYRYDKFKNVKRYYTDEIGEKYLQGRLEEAQRMATDITRIIDEAMKGGGNHWTH